MFFFVLLQLVCVSGDENPFSSRSSTIPHITRNPLKRERRRKVLSYKRPSCLGNHDENWPTDIWEMKRTGVLCCLYVHGWLCTWARVLRVGLLSILQPFLSLISMLLRKIVSRDEDCSASWARQTFHIFFSIISQKRTLVYKISYGQINLSDMCVGVAPDGWWMYNGCGRRRLTIESSENRILSKHHLGSLNICNTLWSHAFLLVGTSASSTWIAPKLKRYFYQQPSLLDDENIEGSLNCNILSIACLPKLLIEGGCWIMNTKCKAAFVCR